MTVASLSSIIVIVIQIVVAHLSYYKALDLNEIAFVSVLSFSFLPFILYFYLGCEWLDRYDIILRQNGKGGMPIGEKIVRILVLVVLGVVVGFHQYLHSFICKMNLIPFVKVSEIDSVVFMVAFAYIASAAFYTIWHVVVRLSSSEVKVLSKIFLSNDAQFFGFYAVLVFAWWLEDLMLRKKLYGGWVMVLALIVAYMVERAFSLAKPSVTAEEVYEQIKVGVSLEEGEHV